MANFEIPPFLKQPHIQIAVAVGGVAGAIALVMSRRTAAQSGGGTQQSASTQQVQTSTPVGSASAAATSQYDLQTMFNQQQVAFTQAVRDINTRIGQAQGELLTQFATQLQGAGNLAGTQTSNPLTDIDSTIARAAQTVSGGSTTQTTRQRQETRPRNQPTPTTRAIQQ